MRGARPVSTPEPEPVSGRFDWRLLFKLGMSAALLALLFYQTDLSRLWAQFRTAAPAWLLGALLLYLLMILVSAWRWQQLLVAQDVSTPTGALVSSYLVATFFNNFLPSNIGGDVIRIRDTSPAARSRTLATMVVLVDRGIGLLGLLLIGALGASVIGRTADAVPVSSAWLWLASAVGIVALGVLVFDPTLVSRLLSPLKRFHQTWVEARLERLVRAFERFRSRPVALVNCLAGAVVVQAILVGFYAAVAVSLRIPIALAHLAVLVPLSFIVQMLPISMNGFADAEATFTAYFKGLGLPIESALALSLLGTATIMVFSLSGAAVYATRR
jgi:uncharacterized membrane protein YbhN (UPF0104 family)